MTIHQACFNLSADAEPGYNANSLRADASPLAADLITAFTSKCVNMAVLVAVAMIKAV